MEMNNNNSNNKPEPHSQQPQEADSLEPTKECIKTAAFAADSGVSNTNSNNYNKNKNNNNSNNNNSNSDVASPAATNKNNNLLQQPAATAAASTDPLEGDPWDGCEDLAESDLIEWLGDFARRKAHSWERLSVDIGEEIKEDEQLMSLVYSLFSNSADESAGSPSRGQGEQIPVSHLR
ncbi:unnamed protein product, partial [Polarella glacialis]